MAAFYLSGSDNEISTLEPLFKPIELNGGESSPEYILKVTLG